MQSQGFINKTGLTFSFSDVNFDSKGLNLVPILLETKETVISDSKIKKSENFPLTMIKTNEFNDKVMSYAPRSSDLNPEVTEFSCFNKPNIAPESTVNIPNNQHEIFSTINNTDIYSNSKSPILENQDNLSIQYEAISYYWFYCVIINGLAEWKPFSLKDSNRIELKFCQYFKNRDTYDLVDDCVPTDGGRYDVFIRKRQKLSVYWEEAPMEIRRASWFYRPEDESFYLPYSECECDKLEERYKYILENNLWHQPFELSGSSDRSFEDRFVFHSPNTMVEYRRFGYLTGSDNIMKGRIVYRGIDGFKNHLEQGESDIIDHVMFVIHGIGSVCDMGGRGIVDCVKSMRTISSTMLKSHFTYHKGRIELIPVSWHSKFHSEKISFDKDLSKVTLKSVPKLRNFTNNTLVDVLCYSSPTYCQTILTIVATEMNRLRHLFVSRNPQYDGSISIAGHSLGSMIAFDLISLQQDPHDRNLIPLLNFNDIPRLEFEVGHLFALGSPISLLLTARGLSFLGEEFYLSHCKGFFNIFHPFDPVAYRLEPMLVRHYNNRPFVVPHHKGRKRLHLELKENLVRVGQDIKSKLFQTLKSTWSSLQEFATAHKTNLSEELADEDELMRVFNKIDSNIGDRDDIGSTTTEMEELVGQLNGGRRVDYVLQEAPLESFNDYLFALGSHACYWESEDTILMMLKEIYLTLNILPEGPHSSERPFTNVSNSNQEFIKDKNTSSFHHLPLLPMVSPSSITSTALPQTFQNIQTKPFFVPNFISDESPEAKLSLSAHGDKNLPPKSMKNNETMYQNVFIKKTEQCNNISQRINVDQSQHRKFISTDFVPPFVPVRCMDGININDKSQLSLSTESPKVLDFYQCENQFEAEFSNFVPITKSQVDSMIGPVPPNDPLTFHKIEKTEVDFDMKISQDIATLSTIDSTSFSDLIISQSLDSFKLPDRTNQLVTKLTESSRYETNKSGRVSPPPFMNLSSSKSFELNTAIITDRHPSPSMETVPLESPTVQLLSDSINNLSKYEFSQINLKCQVGSSPRSTLEFDPSSNRMVSIEPDFAKLPDSRDQQLTSTIYSMPPPMPLNPSMSCAQTFSRNYVYPTKILQTKRQANDLPLIDLQYPPIPMPSQYMTTFQPGASSDNTEPPIKYDPEQVTTKEKQFNEFPPKNIIHSLEKTPNNSGEYPPKIFSCAEIDLLNDPNRGISSIEINKNIYFSKDNFDLPLQTEQNLPINLFQSEKPFTKSDSWTPAISKIQPTQSTNLHYPPMLGNQLTNVFQPVSDKETIPSFVDTHFATIQSDSTTNLSNLGVSSLNETTSISTIATTDDRTNFSMSSHNSSLLSMFKQSNDPDFDSLFQPDQQCPTVDSSRLCNSSITYVNEKSHIDSYSKPKLKSNQELPSYSCRTPSPRISYQGVRNSPKNNSTASSIFSSKPLVPQSGKLFKKK